MDPIVIKITCGSGVDVPNHPLHLLNVYSCIPVIYLQ